MCHWKQRPVVSLSSCFSPEAIYCNRTLEFWRNLPEYFCEPLPEEASMCKQPLETGGSWIVDAGIQGWTAELGGHLKMVGWKIRRSCVWKSLREYGKARFFSSTVWWSPSILACCGTIMMGCLLVGCLGEKPWFLRRCSGGLTW